MDKNPLKITSTTLRDAHQSLLATRLHTDDMVEVLEQIDKVGYFSAEVWGGATFDTCLRYTGENPWERLTTIKKHMKRTPLQMLLRGQNLVGYRHYADDVVEAFVAKAAEHGIDIFRVFDALNDLRNIEYALKQVKKVNKIAEGCIAYTTSPLHTIDKYVSMGKELENMGCDLLCIKDMAGLLTPFAAFELIEKLKHSIKIPIHLHSHCTTGLAVATYLSAAEAGVDIVDCAISTFSMGTSQPAVETMVAIFQGTERDTGFDLKTFEPIAKHFSEMRSGKYAYYDSNLMGVDAQVLIAQVPGGMLSNLTNQLKEMNALDKYDEVLKEIPKVREDFGFPPLVTPTSQIVGVQAVMNVISGERYKVITKESEEYLKGMYGAAPGKVNAELLKKALKDEKPIVCRPADLLKPELPLIDKENNPYLKTMEDKLMYIMFPQPAQKFFEAREAGTLDQYKEKLYKKVEEKLSGAVSADAKNTSGVFAYTIAVDGQQFQVQVAEGEVGEIMVQNVQKAAPVQQVQQIQQVVQQPVQQQQAPVAAGGFQVTSELPGDVIEVCVKPGDRVQQNEKLVVIEAMKMMNDVTSPKSGVVASVEVKVGDRIEMGKVLLTIS